MRCHIVKTRCAKMRTTRVVRLRDFDFCARTRDDSRARTIDVLQRRCEHVAHAHVVVARVVVARRERRIRDVDDRQRAFVRFVQNRVVVDRANHRVDCVVRVVVRLRDFVRVHFFSSFRCARRARCSCVR